MAHGRPPAVRVLAFRTAATVQGIAAVAAHALYWTLWHHHYGRSVISRYDPEGVRSLVAGRPLPRGTGTLASLSEVPPGTLFCWLGGRFGCECASVFFKNVAPFATMVVVSVPLHTDANAIHSSGDRSGQALLQVLFCLDGELVITGMHRFWMQ
jgi:hypothetical protein